MNTLIQPCIRVIRPDGRQDLLTLPGVLAACMQDAITGFTALRPHQRHAWHAFLVQLGTLALLRAGLLAPPENEGAWRDLLRGLTPEHADDAPWCLLGPSNRPALLQPPIPDGIGALKNAVSTPDALDLLVASKNHDLKRQVMAAAAPDDWLFALVSLQTMEGFLGAGNYGISRMNGGFANRPALCLVPPGGPGAHVRRDIRCLLALGGRPPLSEGCAEAGGLALLWLEPWDGAASLPRMRLDPLYIEICRRVRLVEVAGRIAARAGGSKAPRVAPAPGGVTGDPWAPVLTEKDGSLKVLTVDARGFGYRRMVELMFSPSIRHAPLQDPQAEDPAEGLVLLARALTRGQGKTEGYHERRVPLTRRVRALFASRAADRAAATAQERVALAAAMANALRFGLLALLENGPEAVDPRDEEAKRKAETFLRRFDAGVDRDFFPALWRELEQDDRAAREAERRAWVRGLLDQARTLLDVADAAAPKSSRLRYRARVRGRAALLHVAYRPDGLLASWLKEPQRDAA
ncbi:type I-E CRISPR-associated protein Cse1/CasA [Siccirubricoccus sp. KC 17139]|uniref:Type I-E CRISPR-associated protein Cse1/CasA n=1 Tax=Siccirubricoccus soli TaxID=2899147 RepID=A0ABT1D284_9PROT|nr:type I-E CRISPR-associated protein Cse1/CasA [Siccirubricoccus soli]MCO6416033.1 type I-E CRISPR-associated protein Cse1/CasA [Siccirubricoccus soli]MCP2682165.1 type I-E CRISPR-associated protein Cse1/CasA [Siccirubricoccus soli]